MANWFVALPVRPDELPAGLPASLPAGLRRFHPRDLHVTLAFLGDVGETRARAAWDAAAAIAAGPFTVAPGPPAAFGRPRRPSAYGLELGEGSEAVRALIGEWRDTLRAAAGRAPESRSPRPHLTLARPPHRGGDAIRARARVWVERYRPPEAWLHLDRVALYTWSDDRRERQFRIVAERDLPCASRD